MAHRIPAWEVRVVQTVVINHVIFTFLGCLHYPIIILQFHASLTFVLCPAMMSYKLVLWVWENLSDKGQLFKFLIGYSFFNLLGKNRVIQNLAC